VLRGGRGTDGRARPSATIASARMWFSRALIQDVPILRASHILDSKEGHFDPSKFKDEYETALKKLVKRKAAGHTLEPAPEPERPSNVINLMDALRESIEKRGKQRRTSRGHFRKSSSRRTRQGAKAKAKRTRNRRKAA